jgi:hypothetical protein
VRSQEPGVFRAGDQLHAERRVWATIIEHVEKIQKVDAEFQGRGKHAPLSPHIPKPVDTETIAFLPVVQKNEPDELAGLR